jgi:O-methyltransferase
VPEPWRSAYAYSELTPVNLHFLEELTARVGRLSIPGDIVECGVYKGGSAAVLGWAMLKLGDPERRLRLFDSFAGMPEASDRDGELSHSLEGTYVGDEALTRSLLDRSGVPADRVEIVTGFYEDTYPAAEDRPVSLLHIDCDFYEPVRLTFEKFYPHVSPGGFVLLNDYGVYKGAKEATDEYLAEQGIAREPVMIDPTAGFFQKPMEGLGPLPSAGHFPGWEGALA